jgi:ADP-dependent NAD(P)H-hydrate dehydratase / NAD(P)H-hydrate epimerase
MTVRSITQRYVAGMLPERPVRAHKGTFGRVLVVGGSLEFGGAPVLAALGAARTGAGLVCVAAAASVAARVAGSIPELTWLILDEEAPGLISPQGWRRLTAESARFDAAVIGPGLGGQGGTRRRARTFVSEVRIPAVVDADGLNALAESRTWWRGIRSTLVLTPHAVEFARLRGTDAPPEDDDDARVTAARAAAEQWRQVVVLKGAGSIVAGPDDDPRRSDVATPALATAGSGDVLAGVIAALLAAGLPPFAAAVSGVAVHGAAGLLAEDRIGRAGVMARDVAALLPAAIEQLRNDRAR